MNSVTVTTYKDWMKTAAFRDFIAIVVIAFEAVILMEVLELGKIFAETASRKAWPIDKFITMPMIVALAITFYVQNRLKERTIELQEAKKTVETAKNAMSKELRLAGMVQQDFLPEQKPNCDKLRWSAFLLPAECVSGDIYDVKRLDKQYVGFYVADVVGHGMPAALLSIFIKQAIDVYEETHNNSVCIVTGGAYEGCQFAIICPEILRLPVYNLLLLSDQYQHTTANLLPCRTSISYSYQRAGTATKPGN
ncbi:MAG: SpoIIE family protein phosphatase [Planctomycetes bacterium]|nr:SpoIIE family protein phosphatase [Planctomycetota bacterium]